MRIGSKKRPFYRVVAVDERKKRTGGYLDLLGTYNPLTEPKEIILNQEKIDGWKKKGAVMSDGFLRIIGQAPQRPPRKPKKEQKSEGEVTKAAEAPTPAQEAPATEGGASEQPVEEATEQAAPEKAEAEQPAAEEPSDTEETPAEESQPEAENPKKAGE